MPYYTQQLFSGIRDRVLRVVDESTDFTAGFIHIYDQRRVFDFDYAKELIGEHITEAEFEENGGAAQNTFNASFMQIGEDLTDEQFSEWTNLIGREYALVPHIRINMFRQIVKPEIEQIEKDTYEDRILELVTRILGSSQVGDDEKELTIFPSFLLQEQPEQPTGKPGLSITLPE